MEKKVALGDISLEGIVGGMASTGADASNEILAVAEKMANMVVNGGLSEKDAQIVSEAAKALMDAAKTKNYKLAIPTIITSLGQMENMKERMVLVDNLRHLISLK